MNENNNYCNNCGKIGHLFHQCKIPITSIGVIAFRLNKINNNIQYLLIRRKDTLGFIDFLRGKYSLINKEYISNMLKQMTEEEKNKLIKYSFDDLWKMLWGDNNITKYKNEELTSREKFNSLLKGITINNDNFTLKSLINESKQNEKWNEPEWGFPKGRRNYMEKDYDCALREFEEETGYNRQLLNNVNNILPFEEIFTGSNYKSYKHKYYLGNMPYCKTTNTNCFQISEVSKMEWKTYDECIECIRPYNLEKLKLLKNINEIITSHMLFRL
jgi:ADP-ribose pyrophosphatase YjhB (NUDIX family)